MLHGGPGNGIQMSSGSSYNYAYSIFIKIVFKYKSNLMQSNSGVKSMPVPEIQFIQYFMPVLVIKKR